MQVPRRQRDSLVPPGWNANPSSWGQRLPIVGLAVLGLLAAGYLSLFQLGVIATVWEPFFGDGSREILTSSVSRVLPIPDAALGALGYLAEGERRFGVASLLGETAVTARLLEAVLGIWLMAAPAVLGYGPPAATSDRIAGPLIASVAIVAAWEVARPLRHLNLVFGLWLIAAPLLLGFGGADALNSVVVGIAVIALSRWRGRVESRFGGGWSSLWPPGRVRGEEQRQVFGDGES